MRYVYTHVHVGELCVCDCMWNKEKVCWDSEAFQLSFSQFSKYFPFILDWRNRKSTVVPCSSVISPVMSLQRHTHTQTAQEESPWFILGQGCWLAVAWPLPPTSVGVPTPSVVSHEVSHERFHRGLLARMCKMVWSQEEQVVMGVTCPVNDHLAWFKQRRLAT